jgi:hypothetical protein
MARRRASTGTAAGTGARSLSGATLCLGILSASPSGAAQPVIQLSSAAQNTVESNVKIGVSALKTEVRLRNTSTDANAARSYRTGGFLTRSSDGLAYAAAWERRDNPKGDPAQIAPGGELILQLSADIAEPGIYETWIDTFQKDAASGAETPDQRIHLVVTRESEPVGADFILNPQLVPSVFSFFGAPGSSILVQLHNASTRPVEFAPPAILSFSTKNADAQDSVAVSKLPTIDGQRCASPLAPGATCPLALDIPDALWPGQYSIALGVAGRGGGWSQKSVPVSVRFPYPVAFLVTVLGASAGWYVQAWRSSGRRAVNGLIELATLRDRLRRLHGSATGDLEPVERSITDDLDGVESRCRNGADVAADIDRIRQRIDRLVTAATIESAYQSLPQDAQAIFSRWRATLFGQASSASLSDAEASDFNKLRLALPTNINAWPTLRDAIARARTALALAERAQQLPVPDPDPSNLAALVKALRGAIANAVAPLTADAVVNTALVDRATALETPRQAAEDAIEAVCDASAKRLEQAADAASKAGVDPDRQNAAAALAGLQALGGTTDLAGKVTSLARLWSQLQGVAAAQPEGMVLEGVAPGAAPAIPGLDLPTDIVFNFVPGQSLQSLSTQRRRIEIATNLIVLIATGLAGVALVAANDAWGSASDVITALLGGFGARIVLGEVGTASQPSTPAH